DLRRDRSRRRRRRPRRHAGASRHGRELLPGRGRHRHARSGDTHGGRRMSGAALEPHADRLFPADPGVRALARRLYGAGPGLPILSPHGHTDPAWFADDEPFPDPARLFITPDHYVFRMLHSQGIPLETLGVPRRDGGATETDPRKIWHVFAANY